MGDIVEHLRIRAQRQTAAAGITEPHEHIDWMAADEIARLREENARLRTVIKMADWMLEEIEAVEGINTRLQAEIARMRTVIKVTLYD